MKKLLTEYFKIIDYYGPYSHEESNFLNENVGNKELIKITNNIRMGGMAYLPTVVITNENGCGKLPERKHATDLGLDIFAIEDYDLLPGTGDKFKTNIKMSLREGGLLWDKSSSAWNMKRDVGRFVIVCGGAIDESYRGEIIVVLFNLGKEVFEIRKGKAFVQLICKGIPIEVCELTETKRGPTGFGGIKGD